MYSTYIRELVCSLPYKIAALRLIPPHHVVRKSDPRLEPLHCPEGGGIVVAVVDPVRDGVVVHYRSLLATSDTLKLEERDSMQWLFGEGNNVWPNSKVHNLFISDASKLTIHLPTEDKKLIIHRCSQSRGHVSFYWALCPTPTTPPSPITVRSNNLTGNITTFHLHSLVVNADHSRTVCTYTHSSHSHPWLLPLHTSNTYDCSHYTPQTSLTPSTTHCKDPWLLLLHTSNTPTPGVMITVCWPVQWKLGLT